MQRGDTSNSVKSLQSNLRRYGHKLTQDGIFGPATERAVKQFQRGAGLVADGIVGPKTIAALSKIDTSYLLSQSDIENAAHELDVDVAVIMAFNHVESRGQGFIGDRRPAILFERHIMRRRLQLQSIDPRPYEETQPNIVNRHPGGYQGGNREYVRFEKAKAIDTEAAIESTSWGLFQIMGFHWERLGYESPGEFCALMRQSEDAHLDALVRFIKGNPTLLSAIRAKDWRSVAYNYNGPAYATNRYDERLQQAYARFSETDGHATITA